MKKYNCNILYKYNEGCSVQLLERAVNHLGFEAKYMSIFFDEFKNSLDDIKFDEGQLFAILNKKPNTITIKNQLYNEVTRETNFWFRFRLSLDSPFGLDTISLEWSHNNLEFLIGKENSLPKFFDIPGLIYCYCFDQFDCFDQSDDKTENFMRNYPNQEYSTVKNFMNEDVIDTSDHWGRSIAVRGMTFMAAPLMWFGDPFFNIISKKRLLKFNASSLIRYGGFEFVHIKLFELYDSPANEENRKVQKIYWQEFDLQRLAVKYEADRPLDFIAYYKETAIKRKQKK